MLNAQIAHPYIGFGLSNHAGHIPWGAEFILQFEGLPSSAFVECGAAPRHIKELTEQRFAKRLFHFERVKT